MSLTNKVKLKYLHNYLCRRYGKYKPRQKDEGFKIGLLGVPFNKGQMKDGVDEAPKLLRESLYNILDKVKGVCNVTDFGNICNCPPKLKPVDEYGYRCNNLPHLGPVNKMLSEAVQKIIADRRMALVLGGDHSIGIGSIHGHATAVGKDNIAVIWVDAHADINTPATSGSGNVHGMPLSLLIEETRHYWPENIPGFEWQKPVIKASDLAYIGLRDVDKWEKLIIEELDICAFDMKTVCKLGIGDCIKQVLKSIDPEGKKSIHVSFDIDGIDALQAPSTGTPVNCGLDLKQGIRIMHEAFATGRLDVVDLVEVNPKLGAEEDVTKTKEAAVELILAACGENVTL